MKRSEVIEIIQEVIQKGLKEYGASSGRFQRVNTPDEILSALEEAGMLPPFNNEEYMKTWRDGASGHKWEKEEMSWHEYRDAYNKGYIKDED